MNMAEKRQDIRRQDQKNATRGQNLCQTVSRETKGQVVAKTGHEVDMEAGAVKQAGE